MGDTGTSQAGSSDGALVTDIAPAVARDRKIAIRRSEGLRTAGMIPQLNEPHSIIGGAYTARKEDAGWISRMIRGLRGRMKRIAMLLQVSTALIFPYIERRHT